MVAWVRLGKGRGSARSGETRIGRYELLQPLGTGGMAQVFKARARGPGGFERVVVVKRILPMYADDPEYVRMFMHEARLLGMIHHPNVVETYEFGEDQGTLFLALELVEGPSVSRVLRVLRASETPMPFAIAAYVAREVCRALACVHELRDLAGQHLGVVHRDVTPSNIVLTPSGTVKLLDFGVARSIGSGLHTRAGRVKGKPAYLAPEQIEGKPIDGRVDLFALGVVLYEMLALEHLFAAESELISAKRILELDVPRPSLRRSDVPPELDAIVMKALARDPERRYRSAAEMAADLDAVVLGARLRVDQVLAFERDIEAQLRARTAPMAPAARAEVSWPVADGGGAVRRSARPLRSDGGRSARALRAALVASVAVAAALVAAAFGARIGMHGRAPGFEGQSTPAVIVAPAR